MTPRELWSNEAQERYVLAIAPGRLDEFRAMCERERCPFAVIGIATDDDRLEVRDPLFGTTPVDMDLETLLGRPPRMTREAARVKPRPRAFHAPRHRARRGRAAGAAASRRSPTRRSWSRSATARWGACAHATRWWGRGRCP